jgi:GNAT superfamily N-acetyltransferase
VALPTGPSWRAPYERAGFTHTGHTEIVYLARVDDLPRPAGPPLAGLSLRRSVPVNGCRLSAVLGEELIGYIEVETLDEGERLSRHGGWADVGNLRVTEAHRRRGVATWLLGEAAGWLRLAQVDRLLDYAWLEGTDPGGLDLRGLPRVPSGGRVPRAHPYQARLDPCAAAGPGPREYICADGVELAGEILAGRPGRARYAAVSPVPDPAGP